jgi:hypothetical protein
MHEVNGYITETLERLDNSGFLWFAVFVCIIVLLTALWFILRKARLWYWKVGHQIDTLKSIDSKIQMLGEGKRETSITVNSASVKEGVEGIIAEIEELEAKIGVNNKNTEDFTEQETILYGGNNAGKVYTERELEELIKD